MERKAARGLASRERDAERFLAQRRWDFASPASGDLLNEPALVFIRVCDDASEYEVYDQRAVHIASFTDVESRDVEHKRALLRGPDGQIVLTLHSWPLGDGFAVADAAGRQVAQVGPREQRWLHTLRSIRTCDGSEATLWLPTLFGDEGKSGIRDERGEMIACLDGRPDGNYWFMVETIPDVAAPIRAVASVAPMIWCSRISPLP
jgi:hypothetical protein